MRAFVELLVNARTRVVACAATLCLAMAFAAVSQAAPLSWPASLQSSFAPALQSGAGEVSLTGTACWASASCVAVGEDDLSGGEDAIVVLDSAGVPGQAITVKLPAGAQSGASEAASLNAVSCSPSGGCVAVGEYLDTSGNTDALVVPISAGVVGTGIEVTPPGAPAQFYLRSVSCPVTGACLAAGTYGSTASQDGVVVPISGGAPSTAVEVTLPGNANTTTPTAWLNSVSCWAGGSCVAAGQYQSTASNGAIYPMVVLVAGGAPAAAVEVALPGNARTSGSAQQSVLGSVSCESSGLCVAVGSYVDASGGSQPLVVPVSGGKPAPAGVVSLPANAAGPAADAGLDGVSCAPTGPCSAAGSYLDTYGSGEALVVPISGGVAAAGIESSLPANALASSSGYQEASLDAVSCPLSGSCVATGSYADGSANQQPLVVPISATTSTPGNEVSLPVSETANPDASLSAVACASSYGCVAAGQYHDATAQTQGFESSLQTPLSITSSSLKGAKLRSAYSATLNAAGAWGSYSWSVVFGVLPTGLRLNAKTGLISGKPSTLGDYRFTLQASSVGNPAQTVSRRLSIVVSRTPVLTVSVPRGGLELSGKDVNVRLRCTVAACRGSLKLVYTHYVMLRHHKRRRESTVIARAEYSLAKRRSRTLKLRLTAAGLRFVKAARRHRLSVTLDVALTGGRATSKHTVVYSATVKKPVKR